MEHQEFLAKIEQSTAFIRDQLEGNIPEVGLILGSGLGVLSEQIGNPLVIKYEQIPGFPVSTVEGHAGELVVGELEGKVVLALKGRFHYYEGYTIQQVTLPVRMMKKLGIENLIITNAAGGINEDFEPGDIMIIKDHINFAFVNPLIGANLDEFGPRFPDLSRSYSPELIQIAEQAAQESGLVIKEGVYMYGTGPSYETPAEVRAVRFLGADAVGMSTVPEVLAAVHSGMKVLGISCISNMAAGIMDQPLTHREVMETTEKIKDSFSNLVRKIVAKI